MMPVRPVTLCRAYGPTRCPPLQVNTVNLSSPCRQQRSEEGHPAKPITAFAELMGHHSRNEMIKLANKWIPGMRRGFRFAFDPILLTASRRRRFWRSVPDPGGQYGMPGPLEKRESHPSDGSGCSRHRPLTPALSAVRTSRPQ